MLQSKIYEIYKDIYTLIFNFILIFFVSSKTDRWGKMNGFHSFSIQVWTIKIFFSNEMLDYTVQQTRQANKIFRIAVNAVNLNEISGSNHWLIKLLRSSSRAKAMNIENFTSMKSYFMIISTFRTTKLLCCCRDLVNSINTRMLVDM